MFLEMGGAILQLRVCSALTGPCECASNVIIQIVVWLWQPVKSIIQMLKNKSSSVSISNRSSGSASKNNSSSNVRKASNTRPKKPTIDREIAKKLDTLDRQGLKYLKESLRASRFLEHDKNLEVEEQIVEGDFAERPLKESKRTGNEIEEEIAEIVEIQEDEETIVEPQVKKVMSGGRVKTCIKARPISAVQKEQPVDKNFSIDLHCDDRSFSKVMSPHSELISNPFKKMQKSQKYNKGEQPEKPQKPSKPTRAAQPQSELKSLLKRIEKLQYGQRAQLEVILERMEKGEIDSVEMSSDVIVLGRSNSKAEMATVEYPPQVQRPPAKPVKSAMQKNRGDRNVEIQEEIEEDLMVQEKVQEEEVKKLEALKVQIPKIKEKKEEPQPKIDSPVQEQPSLPAKPKIAIPTRMTSSKNIMDQVLKVQQPVAAQLPPKKDKKKAASLTLRILDTWGHQSTVGLTQLQLFDTKGRKIAITYQQLVNPNRKIFKLFSGKCFTVDESEMWFSSIPRAPNQLEIEVNCRQVIGAIRIWNYNKSLLESNKGVKEAEVEIKGTRVWLGEVRRGAGNEVEDYSTLVVIGLEPGVQIPPPEREGAIQVKVEEVEKRIPQTVIMEPKIQAVVPSLKVGGNKPTWLEGTLVANKLEELRRQQIKYQQEAKQVQSTKRKLRGRQTEDRRSIDLSKQSSAKLEPSPMPSTVFTEQKPKPVQQGIHLKFQPSERQRFLQKQAEDVCRDVQNSLLNVKKNLHLQGDDIFTEMLGNRKSIAVIEKDKQSKFRRDDSSKRRFNNEEVVVRQEKSMSSQVKVDKGSQRNLKVDPSVKEILTKDLIKEVEKPVTQKLVDKQKQKHQLPSVRELNKASQLDNLIDQLNSMMPSTQKVAIPELPQGQVIKINFLLTWGDPYYVGMAGIEFFNSNGEAIQIQPNQIKSKYSMSSQEKKDPRTVDKLVNGVYLTSDGHNQWLSPFHKDSNVVIDFSKPVTLSMIRIWNYNQSRIHSTRGVRYISIQFDNKVIFQGQIRKANGQTYNQERLCEYIMFSADNELHKRICEKDWLSTIKKQENVEQQSLRDTLVMFKRPTTSIKQNQQVVQRQQTQVLVNYEKRFIQEYETATLPKGYSIRIVIRSTWGDLHFVGLNGIEIYNEQGAKLLSSEKYKLKANPNSLNVLPGYQKDVRTVDKLVNGVNQTFNDTNMWLSPFVNDLERLDRRQGNTITLQFQKSIILGAIDFFNYTKTPCRGARQIQIHLDETLIFMGYLRRGPSRDQPNPVFKTSVTFCKDPDFLKKIRFLNYNEDTLEQQVSLINQQKTLSSQTAYEQLPRPGTSVTGKEPQQKFL